MGERNPEKGVPSCSRAFLRVEKRGGRGSQAAGDFTALLERLALSVCFRYNRSSVEKRSLDFINTVPPDM